MLLRYERMPQISQAADNNLASATYGVDTETFLAAKHVPADTASLLTLQECPGEAGFPSAMHTLAQVLRA